MSSLFKVSHPADAVGSIIFLHGLNGDAHTTWQHEAGSDHFWPAWLAQDLPRCAVWTFGYDASASDWTGCSMALPNRGVNLLSHLINEDLQTKPLVFVGHSLGGLVAKQTLRAAADRSAEPLGQVFPQTRGVAFLATPHAGSDLATWMDRLRTVLGAGKAVYDLKADSAYLLDLNTWYRNVATNKCIPTLSLFETRTYRNVIVVDQTSADPGIPNSSAIGVEEDHRSIAKPSGRDSQVYKSVKRFVDQLLCPLDDKATGESPSGRTEGRDLGPEESALPDWAARAELVKLLQAHPAALAGIVHAPGFPPGVTDAAAVADWLLGADDIAAVTRILHDAHIQNPGLVAAAISDVVQVVVAYIARRRGIIAVRRPLGGGVAVCHEIDCTLDLVAEIYIAGQMGRRTEFHLRPTATRFARGKHAAPRPPLGAVGEPVDYASYLHDKMSPGELATWFTELEVELLDIVDPHTAGRGHAGRLRDAGRMMALRDRREPTRRYYVAIPMSKGLPPPASFEEGLRNLQKSLPQLVIVKMMIDPARGEGDYFAERDKFMEFNDMLPLDPNPRV
jgi:pimeloyl-ACP methyl ester carboxylesterase